jgi:hypothetical protein
MKNVAAIVDVTSYAKYAALSESERLGALGLAEDTTPWSIFGAQECFLLIIVHRAATVIGSPAILRSDMGPADEQIEESHEHFRAATTRDQRAGQLYHHVDPGFVNHRLCFNVIGPSGIDAGRSALHSAHRPSMWRYSGDAQKADL